MKVYGYTSFDLDRSNKIAMVKKMRDLSGLGLKESKDAIDNVCNGTTGKVTILWSSTNVPSLFVVCNDVIDRDPPSATWKIIIRDPWDDYNKDEIKFTGTDLAAQDEANYYADKNIGCKVFLYRAVTETFVPKTPKPTITKL